MNRLRDRQKLRPIALVACIILLIGLLILATGGSANADQSTAPQPNPTVATSFALADFPSCRQALQLDGEPAQNKNDQLVDCAIDAVNTLIAYKERGVSVDPRSTSLVIAYVRSLNDQVNIHHLWLEPEEEALLGSYIKRLDTTFPAAH